jgi:hypothetical protein
MVIILFLFFVRYGYNSMRLWALVLKENMGFCAHAIHLIAAMGGRD